ncbi:MAG: TonB-dependent receptor [Proteobacteria bacterium]|nr:TonB-dependent receptor [Pseudomonadota bacterium]
MNEIIGGFMRYRLTNPTFGLAIVTLGAFSVATPVLRAAESESDESPAVLSEIIVTARKRAEDVRDVPISITTLSADQIDKMGARDFRELDGYIPNMIQVGPESNISPLVSIRGVSSDTRNAGFESGITEYIDGVYTGRPVAWSSELLDVQGLEVLKGPQGSLFGKNAIGGAINITTRKPDKDVRILGEAEIGNFDLARAAGSISGPLVDDTVFGGVSVYKTYRNGIQTNVVNGKRYWNKNDYGGRAQLRFKPNESWDVNLSFDGLKEGLRPNIETVTAGFGTDAIANPRQISVDAPVFSQRSIYGMSLNAVYTLPGGTTITSITAQRWNEEEFLSDDDQTAAPLLFSHFKDNERQFTQELRVASPGTGRFRYVAGVYYYNQHALTDRITTAPAGGLAPVDLAASLYGLLNTHDYAAFAQADYSITDALTLTAGGRYTDERKNLLFELNGLPPFGIISITPAQRYTRSDSNFTPTGSLVYKFNPIVNGYVSVSRGFKGGGFNADFVSNPQLGFAPEKMTNYEIGVKAEDTAQRVRGNISFYNMDYKDMQVSILSPIGGFIIANAQSATIRGVEMDAAAALIRGLDVTLAAAYNDAKFDRFDAGTSSRVPDAPKATASFGADYRIPVGTGSLTLRGEYNYRSDYLAAASNGTNDPVPGYSLVNARLTYATARDLLRVQLWVDNIADRTYITDRGAPLGGLLGQASVTYGKPRTYGVQLSTRLE